MEPMYMFPSEEEFQAVNPVLQSAPPHAYFDGNVEVNAPPEAWYIDYTDAVQRPAMQMYDNFDMGNGEQLNYAQDQLYQWHANDHNNVAANAYGQSYVPMDVNVDVNYNYNYNVHDQVQYENQWLNVNANEHYLQDQQLVNVNYAQPFAGHTQEQLPDVEYNYNHHVPYDNQWFNVNVNEQLHAPIDDNVNYNNQVQYEDQWTYFNANEYHDQDGFHTESNGYGMSTTPDEEDAVSTTGSAKESESPRTHRYILRSKGPAPPADDSDDESDYSSDDEERDSFKPDQEPDVENKSSGNAYIRCEWPRTDGKPCHKMIWVHLPPKGTKRVDAKDRQPSNNVYKHLLECEYHEDVKWELWKLPCKFGPECQGSSATMKCDGIGRHVTSTVSHLNRWIKYEKDVERDGKGVPTGKIRFTKVPLDMDEVDADDKELLEKHNAARDVLYNPVRKVAVEL
ncbi:hypothetical protein CVT24_009143 [Panaeolus cyanescens]|uniref:Uncharacterized protein n=1 Tax=Panaeolus cyanescens TaxID=181874 RepID=A0A409WCN8_9AGAR|nr:hypothetical protein CVT24_009143 [Panaeolus cyanescens]